MSVTTTRPDLRKKFQRNGSSGHRGVCWCKHSRKWKVYTTVDNRQVAGGYFHDLDEAAAAAVALRKRLLPFSNEERAA